MEAGKLGGWEDTEVLTMQVTVKLISTFSQYKKNLDDGKATLKEGDTVEVLARKIGLPVKYLRLIFVNGKQADLDTVLSEGDNVFFPPAGIAGG